MRDNNPERPYLGEVLPFYYETMGYQNCKNGDGVHTSINKNTLIVHKNYLSGIQRPIRGALPYCG